MITRDVGQRLALLAVCALATLAPATTVLAQPSSATVTTLTIQTGDRIDESGNPVKGQLLVVAKLLTSDGKPVSGRAIDFYEPVNFFGSREEILGAAVTDGTGAAAIVDTPVVKGPQQIRARFAGDSAYAPATASTTVDAAIANVPFESTPIPFANLTEWINIGISLLGILFWAVLLGVFVRTVVTIRNASS